MAYEKHLWVAKEKVTADKLNHIEEGIANAGEGGGGGGSFSVDSTGAPRLSDLAVRKDPPFIKFKLKDSYTEDELSWLGNFGNDVNWINITTDYKTITVTPDIGGDFSGIMVDIEDQYSGDYETYGYLSDDTAEAIAQFYGITPPAHVWLKLDLDSKSYAELDHAPELKLSTDFDAYMYNSLNFDLLNEGIYNALARIIFNADGSFKEHYTKEDEANLQGLIDAAQVDSYEIDRVLPGNPDGDIAGTIGAILTRFSQMESLMNGEERVGYAQDYFPIIIAPHFGASEEDTYIYFYKFADFDKKMQELSGESLPGEPDRWYKLTFDSELTPITVPDVDTSDIVHDYLYMNGLFDCSETVAAAQKVFVRRARKNHIIPMSWYNAYITNNSEFYRTRAEGDIDGLYGNYFNNILSLDPTGYRLDSAISTNSGWQNAIEFGCWVNSIQLDLTLSNGNPDDWQYSWFEHFANSVLCGDKVRLFFDHSNFGGYNQPRISFAPTTNSSVEIGLASSGPNSINTYADFTSAQRLMNYELVLHGHLPVTVFAEGQTNEEEPQSVSYNNRNFLIPVSLHISCEPGE